jgi:hypothetical protein
MVLGFWTDFELPDHLARSAGSTVEFGNKEQVRTAQLEKGTGPAYVFLDLCLRYLLTKFSFAHPTGSPLRSRDCYPFAITNWTSVSKIDQALSIAQE